MGEFLKNQVEQSQSSEAVKAETTKILDEAKEIRARLDNEEAQKEYDEVRFATIGALKDLRTETHEDLETIRAELGNGGSIDPFTYSEGEINQEELGNITREFSDLAQLESNNEGDEELGFFGSQMLGYIESTNKEILSGGESELTSQINWYLTAFGSDEGSGGLQANAAYLGASATLSSETMQSSVEKLMDIKNSSDRLETKLFQLSQVLYEVGKEAGAPAGLETAHNTATRNIIKKVIESSEGNFAVGYSEVQGYFMTESIASASSELEVGTYLGSLNKSGKLNYESISQIFSPTELFVILERYKNGEFQDENVTQLFSQESYLSGFKENMEKVIADTLSNSSSGTEIVDCMNSGTESESLASALGRCELCSKIDSFTIEDINNISDECWRALEENQSELAEGLKKKLEHANESRDRIEAHLTEIVIGIVGNDIPEGLQEKIHVTSEETFLFMEEYFDRNPQEICSIDFKMLFTESTNSPLLELKGYIQNNYRVIIDDKVFFASVDTTVNEGFSSQIQTIETNIQTAQKRLEGILSIPEDERTAELLSELQALEQSITEWTEDKKALEERQKRAREIKTEEIVSLNREQITELKRYMLENSVSWPEAYKDVVGKKYDFSNQYVVDYFINNPQNIYSVKDSTNAIEFLNAIEGRYIDISYFHPNVLLDLNVVKQLLGKNSNNSLKIINTIPESFFGVDSGHDLFLNISTLLKNSSGLEGLILSKINRENSSLKQKRQALNIIKDLLVGTYGELESNSKSRLIAELSKSDFIQHDHNGEILGEIVTYQGLSEDDQKNMNERFDNIYRIYSNGAIQLGQEENDFINDYFSSFGSSEKHRQFLYFLKNGNIEGQTLEKVVPYLQNLDVILTGIETVGVNFTELLPQEWHSNERVIQKTLESCFIYYEGVSHSLNLASQKNKLKKAASILKITDAPGLYAAYIGVGENKSLFGDLFWHTFDGDISLQAIVDDAGERYTNKFTQDKVHVIVELVRYVSEKKQKEQEAIKEVSQLIDIVQEDTSGELINFSGTYLENRFPDEKYSGHINGILESLNQRGGIENSATYENISNLLKENGETSQEQIQEFIKEFFAAVRNESILRQASLGERTFLETDIGSFDRSLLVPGDNGEGFKLGTPETINGERVNAVLSDFDKDFGTDYLNEEKLNEYLAKYSIDSTSIFGKTLKDFLRAEGNILSAHDKTTEEGAGEMARGIEEFIETENSDAIKKAILEANGRLTNGDIDTSGIPSVRKILDDNNLTIGPGGNIIPAPNYTLSTDNENSPDTPQKSRHTDSFNTGDGWLHKSAEGRAIVDYGGETKLIVNSKVQIPITTSDISALKDSPEAEGNFIEFYQNLQKLNLEEFWDYKDIIFQTISNKSASSGLDLSDKGYIDENDMSLFLYTIADSISESSELSEAEQNDIHNMRGQKQDFGLVYSMMERINKQTGLAQNEDESVLRNEGRVGRIFREMYFSKSEDKNTQSLIFKRELFEENIGK